MTNPAETANEVAEETGQATIQGAE